MMKYGMEHKTKEWKTISECQMIKYAHCTYYTLIGKSIYITNKYYTHILISKSQRQVTTIAKL